MNFTSGEKDLNHYLKTIATNINPEVDAYVKEHATWHKSGVILVNFAGSSNAGNYDLVPHLVKHIIEVNDL